MREAPKTSYEAARLAKLESYNILDTLPEKLYDDITFIASHICETPISLVSLIDRDRQWFKSKIGLEAEETPRSVAFCAHAIHNDELFYIPDATKDERFHDNPLVRDSPNVIFYAGAPIVTPEGHKLGTLCVIDNKPRELSEEQKSVLTRLSRQVASNLELRLSMQKLEDVNEELVQFAYRTSHDLKAPVTASKRLMDYVIGDLDNGNLDEARLNILKSKDLMEGLEVLIQDILSLVKADIEPIEKELVDISKVVESIEKRLVMLADELNCQIITSIEGAVDIHMERGRISQIIENLVSNGIKYRDVSKKKCFVKVGISKTDSVLAIIIEDNGVGIPQKFQKDMFKMFKRFNPELSFGSGLGMSIVKKHIDRLGGKINFSSSEEGTVYNIKLPINTEG